MHFHFRVSTTAVHELLFADDGALNTTSEGDMQRSMDLFATACENFGLIINTEKKVVMHQPPLNTAHNAPQISLNGTQLQMVDNFTSLGSTLLHSTKSTTKLPAAFPKPSKPSAVYRTPSGTVTVSISKQSWRWIFRAPTGHVAHLRTKCSIRTAPTDVSPSTSPPPLTPSVNPRKPLLPSSSSTASTSAVVASAMTINDPDEPPNNNTATVNTSDEERVYTCPHCDRTFTSHVGLVGHLRIHRTETGEPVPGAPTYTRHIRLHCPLCTRTFIRRMG
nr:unnamed protein product [Spirometra erinaceieuropaei]